MHFRPRADFLREHTPRYATEKRHSVGRKGAICAMLTPAASTLLLLWDFLHNMGLRYVAFRFWFEIKRRSGLLRRAFPTRVAQVSYIDLATWRALDLPFLGSSRAALNFAQAADPVLEEEIAKLKAGDFKFFSATYYPLGKQYDWLTHPVTGYRYSQEEHWTSIPDLDPVRGDIKYIWEPARFSHLLKIIRHDFHTGTDHGEWVLAGILDWIAQNPVNQGPNWRCSQEISLRSLNWLFALHYYREHPALTPARFEQIMQVLYWQVEHVYQNIHFSRIAVRNNHAITETLLLFVAGLQFPFFPQAERWKTRGKAWLEQEIGYQIYSDGTYLQHAMNYHRVVVQLLSWGIVLGELHHDPLSPQVYERAKASLHFLTTCLEEQTGHLPNYGNNDGALFFPFSTSDYRDYRPQLNALSCILGQGMRYDSPGCREEAFWYGIATAELKAIPTDAVSPGKARQFPQGGYFTWRDSQSFTFIRCASYRDRPAQADNLHLDIWVAGQNILQDAGTYLYNSDAALLQYFWGTKGHNTASLGGHDQMFKGGRFIWFFWSKATAVATEETAEYWFFKGTIACYRHLGKSITHTRSVKKFKHKLVWEVQDSINHSLDLPLLQYWHPARAWADKIQFSATDEAGQILAPEIQEGWYSSYYGNKEVTPLVVFQTAGKMITTQISIV